jgi:hypothetical protein
MAGRGRFFTALGKNWTTADPAVKAAEEVYALATFLLVDDGTGVFGFSTSKAESLAPSALDTLDIGAPARAAVKDANGGWTRGQVLVNPTTGTITLNGVSLGPTSARIVTS